MLCGKASTLLLRKKNKNKQSGWIPGNKARPAWGKTQNGCGIGRHNGSIS